MTNHVANKLVISGKDINLFEQTMDRLNHHGELVQFCFNHIVPMTSEVNKVASGFRELEILGEKGWFGWSEKYWGTKWDCYDVKVVKSKSKSKIEIWFDTAWSPPKPYFDVLVKKFPTLEFRLYYCDSGYPFFGSMLGKNGVIVKDIDGEDDTRKRGNFRKYHKLHSYS